MSEEPVRMHLDPALDAELRATLEAARADRVDDDRIERLALRLGPLLGPPGGGGGGGGGGTAKAAATASAAKGGGVIAAAKGLALVAALGAAGTFVWIDRNAPREPVETSADPAISQPAPIDTPREPAVPEPAIEPATDTSHEAPDDPPEAANPPEAPIGQPARVRTQRTQIEPRPDDDPAITARTRRRPRRRPSRRPPSSPSCAAR
jgi:hypothetical protein